MGRISRGFTGILAGFAISVASFGLLLSVGFSAIRSGAGFTPDNPVIAVLRLSFYLGMFVMFGSPLYFWMVHPCKEAIKKILRLEETQENTNSDLEP